MAARAQNANCEFNLPLTRNAEGVFFFVVVVFNAALNGMTSGTFATQQPFDVCQVQAELRLELILNGFRTGGAGGRVTGTRKHFNQTATVFPHSGLQHPGGLVSTAPQVDMDALLCLQSDSTPPLSFLKKCRLKTVSFVTDFYQC